MAIIVAMDDIKPDGVRRRGEPGKLNATSTTFFRGYKGEPDAPAAFQMRYDPGRVSRTHFHVVDEFQVIVDGKGTFGRHALSPYCVHFARAYTPYGPLKADDKTGWAFLTLRAHSDHGPQFLPESSEKLKQIPHRQPWQITKKITFPARNLGVSFQADADLQNDQGLFACALTMTSHTRTMAPDPVSSDGQYILVVRGTLLHKEKHHKALTVVFVKPDDDSFQILSGPEGLDAIILNFPQSKSHLVQDEILASVKCGPKKWRCGLCAFVYDEALGIPGDGIPAGMRWESVPETWSCPDCSAGKNDFAMVKENRHA